MDYNINYNLHFQACQEKVNEDVFINILSTVSYPQLYATFACFEELANENIESVVRKNLKGNLKKACLTMSTFFFFLMSNEFNF